MTNNTGEVIEPGKYSAYQGDCVELIRELPADSVGLSVFSPPFPGMYAYTDSERDMGNCRSIEEMMAHFRFLIPELLRVTLPGRCCVMHIAQEPVFQWRDGYSGLRDFRGELIRAMTADGWIWRSERFIDKDPQLKAARTKDTGLAMKTAAKDSARLTGVMPDILLQFVKPGDNPIPIRALIDHTDPKLHNPDGWLTREEWIEWASAIWWNAKRGTPDGGIRESDVLDGVKAAKDADDEKHLCPLQLGVIERCVKLWSAPGDLVLSPFMGIGSEGFKALELGRMFVGFELKPSYFRVACENLAAAAATRQEQIDIEEFATAGEESIR